MIRFPAARKRAQLDTLDLEDEDIVEIEPSAADPEDMIDTTVLERGPVRAALARSEATGAIAPLSVTVNEDRPRVIARLERGGLAHWVQIRLLAAFGAAKPNLPWAAVLVAIGAMGTAVAMHLLDALATPAHAQAPAAEAAPAEATAAPPPQPEAVPPPAPRAEAAKPLQFGEGDAVTVIGSPRPTAPAVVAKAAPRPVFVPLAAPAPAAIAPKKAAAAAAAPAPRNEVQRAAVTDALADEQLKAALR